MDEDAIGGGADPARVDRSAIDRLYALVYRELHALAACFLASERQDHTLQPTALVSESYVRLASRPDLQVNDRRHFIAVASQAMRHVLVDHARRRGAEKRGGGRERVAISTHGVAGRTEPERADCMAFQEALESLEKIDSVTARVVELRYFGGATVDEAAEILRLSVSTVEREWRYARAWLRDRLG